MRGYAKILPIVFALLLVSCAKQDTGAGPHATVVMRDGTQYAGSVTNTTPSEVTLKGDDNAMHTLAMKDVKSIEYDDAAAPPPAETAQFAAGAWRRLARARRAVRRGEVRLTVADTGGGIPAELIEHVFEPFVTTKGPDRGTGLGLSICFGLVKAMGGTIGVANGPEGAVFTITLPAAPAGAV